MLVGTACGMADVAIHLLLASCMQEGFKGQLKHDALVSCCKYWCSKNPLWLAPKGLVDRMKIDSSRVLCSLKKLALDPLPSKEFGTQHVHQYYY
jgi:hypothetical protein